MSLAILRNLTICLWKNIRRESKTKNKGYPMNICRHCGSGQGWYFIYRDINNAIKNKKKSRHSIYKRSIPPSISFTSFLLFSCGESIRAADPLVKFPAALIFSPVSLYRSTPHSQAFFLNLCLFTNAQKRCQITSIASPNEKNRYRSSTASP